jgi:endogenous inhibitor of DNA gyrase (YacG/DUF329 family)
MCNLNLSASDSTGAQVWVEAKKRRIGGRLCRDLTCRCDCRERNAVKSREEPLHVVKEESKGMTINEMEFLGAIADLLDSEASKQSDTQYVVFDRGWIVSVADNFRTMGLDTNSIERSARLNGSGPSLTRERERDAWKRYPVKISGLVESGCCHKPTLLVQSMDGGFVTRNCPGCGKSRALDQSSFEEIARQLWVECPSCKARMFHDMIDKNYGFRCPRCKERVLLAELVPWWHDLI